MNWLNLRSLIRVHLDDPAGNVWSDASLLKDANEAVRQLTVDCESTIKHVQIPMVAGTRTYALPDDCFEVRNVKLNQSPLVQTHSQYLEELDSQYLTTTGIPSKYYLEDIKTLAFYPVPTWTDSLTTFDSEWGVMVSWDEDGTYATMDSDFGCVFEAWDSTMAREFQVEPIQGIAIQQNDYAQVALVSYVYRPPSIVYDTDVPDLPEYMQYAIAYFVDKESLQREGIGQNKPLAEFFKSRYDELQKEWFAENKSNSKGFDQWPTRKPVDWRNDLRWKDRIYA